MAQKETSEWNQFHATFTAARAVEHRCGYAGIKHWQQRFFGVSLTMHFQLFTGLLKVSFWKPCIYLSWTFRWMCSICTSPPDDTIHVPNVYPSNPELLIFIRIYVVKQFTCRKMCVRHTLASTATQFRRAERLLFSIIAIAIEIFILVYRGKAFLTSYLRQPSPTTRNWCDV